MSSPRRSNNSKTYIPDTSEISHIVDQYIDDQHHRGRDTRSSGAVGIGNISDIQAYIMENNPSWSVPEKRRLQKFVKRAMAHRSSASEPSTPSSQQSETTADSVTNGLDNRSERSRSSRLKGITNRLFGGGSSNIPTKSKPQIPVLEIQTTTKHMANKTDAPFTEPEIDSVLTHSGKTQEELNQESSITENVVTTVQKFQETADGLATDNANHAVASKDIDDMYNDDNDGKIAKGEKCCFFWFC